MSTILSEYNPSFKAHQSKPNEPKSSVFTCLSCQVAFPSSERQRAHYRTDWHKYNLKRKVAQLTPLSAERFSEKVLAQQALGREEAEKQGLIYECLLCKKQYSSENGYNNHIQSKKHLELEQLADQAEEEAELAESNTNDESIIDNETNTNNKSLFDSEPSSLANSRILDPQLDCLFCSHSAMDIDKNLDHMSKSHGFFLPDIEYLKGKEGLLSYLSMKINNEKLCLFCNGRGKEWHSVAAARAHMIDRGHCKMAYDESEDPEELLKYYDFGVDDAMDVDSNQAQGEDELILENGAKVGHRKFMKYYKRHAARKPLATEPEEAQQLQKHEEPESLRRKERRHLAITDGKEQDLKKTADGIKEAKIAKEFSRNLSYKQNANVLFRFRTQNPI